MNNDEFEFRKRFFGVPPQFGRGPGPSLLGRLGNALTNAERIASDTAIGVLRTPGLLYVSQDGETVYRLTGDDLSHMPAAERTYLRGLLAEVIDDVIDQRDSEIADRLGSAGPARGHHVDKVIVDDTPGIPAGWPPAEWDHFAVCGICRDFAVERGISVPPWLGNRSAG